MICPTVRRLYCIASLPPFEDELIHLLFICLCLYGARPTTCILPPADAVVLIICLTTDRPCTNIWIIHGAAGNSKQILTNIDVTTLQPGDEDRICIIARGEAEGYNAYEIFTGGLQWRYRGQDFLLLASCYMHYSFYYMASPTTYSSPTDLKYQNFISLIFYFAQMLVHEQLTIARCHGVTDVSKSGIPN